MSIRILVVALAACALHAQSGLESLLQAEQLIREGRYDRARRVATLAIESTFGTGEASLPNALNYLGSVCYNLDLLSEANWYYLKATSLWERGPAPDPAYALALTNLSALRQRQGRLSDAEKLSVRASGILDQFGKPNSDEVISGYNGLAELLYGMKRPREAEGYARKALAGSDSSKAGRGTALFWLARLRRDEGQTAEAESLMRQAMAVWEATLGRRHATTASGLASLAEFISETSPQEAERLFLESLAVMEEAFGPDNSLIGEVLGNYSKLLTRQRGRKREAKALAHRSAEIAARYYNQHPGRHSVDWRAHGSGTVR